MKDSIKKVRDKIAIATKAGDDVDATIDAEAERVSKDTGLTVAAAKNVLMNVANDDSTLSEAAADAEEAAEGAGEGEGEGAAEGAGEGEGEGAGEGEGEGAGEGAGEAEEEVAPRPTHWSKRRLWGKE